MELTTDLAVRIKSNGVTAAAVPRAYRHPTPLDWERWAPTIAARYKSVPARVLIGEMNAEGLHVTYVSSQMACIRDTQRLILRQREDVARPSSEVGHE